MCNVLLITCNSDASSGNLKRSTGDAIGVIGRLDKGSVLRERHLYGGAIPVLSEAVTAALRTDPRRRSASQWQLAAATDMLLREARLADVLVIALPLETGGALPRELVEWGVHVGLAGSGALLDAKQPARNHAKNLKLAIVIAEALEAGTAGADNLAHVTRSLEALLAPLGVDEVVLFEADADGYPIRQATLMPIVSRSIAVH
jgi:FMN-dependent NADH-azoreductase